MRARIICSDRNSFCSVSRYARPLLVLGLLLLLTHIGWAAVVNVGKYRVNVDVRTSLMVIIPHALIQGDVKGSLIKIRVSAPGYLPQNREILIKPNINYYSIATVLRDVPKRIDVRTFDYKPIASSYVEHDQTNVPPDLYGFSVFIPIKSWPHAGPDRVIVNQPGYGWPMQESCEITTREDFYQVKLTVLRGVLDDPNPMLFVYLNTGETLSGESTSRWFARLRWLEERRPVVAGELARAIVDSLPADVTGVTVPRCIDLLLEQKRAFDELHERP